MKREEEEEEDEEEEEEEEEGRDTVAGVAGCGGGHGRDLGAQERGGGLSNVKTFTVSPAALCLDLSSLFDTLSPLLFPPFAPVCRVHPVSRLRHSRQPPPPPPPLPPTTTTTTQPPPLSPPWPIHATFSIERRVRPPHGLNHPDYATIHTPSSLDGFLAIISFCRPSCRHARRVFILSNARQNFVLDNESGRSRVVDEMVHPRKDSLVPFSFFFFLGGGE